MGRVIHFEICSSDLAPVLDFYSKCFGWTITPKEDGYYIIHTGSQDEKGINGGLTKGDDIKQGIIPTINVDSVKKTIAEIKKAGGTVREKTKVLPGTGYVAYCTDPNGNWLTIIEYDSKAK